MTTALKNAFNKVVSNRADAYNPTYRRRIGDIRVSFKESDKSIPREEAFELIRYWEPIFDDLGWLDRLQSVSFTPFSSKTKGGNYCDGVVQVTPEAEVMASAEPFVVGADIEHALIHEMIHHAHIELGGYDGEGHKPPVCRERIRKEVSFYAGKNIYETVAETGVAIALGHDAPKWAHKVYEKYDGPTGVYEIRELR